MRMMFWLLAAALGMTVAGSPAGADSLVLKDGTRLETRGEFKVKGRQVVFTDAQGRLKALPLAEVDLEASKAPPPVAPPTPAAPPKAPAEKKVVMTLTNKDVGGEVDPLIASLGLAQLKSVEMYTTTWCPACKKARQYLDLIGIPYREYDVEKDPGARARQMSKHSSCGVPVIDIEGTIICGWDGKAVLKALGIERPPRPDAVEEAPASAVDTH